VETSPGSSLASYFLHVFTFDSHFQSYLNVYLKFIFMNKRVVGMNTIQLSL
jgi:hypothetical protein